MGSGGCERVDVANAPPFDRPPQILDDFLRRVPKDQLELMHFPEEPDEYFGCVRTRRVGDGDLCG